MTDSGSNKLKCSFCDTTQEQVRKIISGPGVYICDRCLGSASDSIDGGSPPTLAEEARCSFCGKNQSMVRSMFQQSHTVICDECVELCWEILDEDLEGAPPSDSGFAKYFSDSGAEPTALFAPIGQILDAASFRPRRNDSTAALTQLLVGLTTKNIAPCSLDALPPLRDSITACDQHNDLLVAAQLLEWKLLIEQRHTPNAPAVQRTLCALIATDIHSGKKQPALDHLSLLNELIHATPKPPNKS